MLAFCVKNCLKIEVSSGLNDLSRCSPLASFPRSHSCLLFHQILKVLPFPCSAGKRTSPGSGERQRRGRTANTCSRSYSVAVLGADRKDRWTPVTLLLLHCSLTISHVVPVLVFCSHWPELTLYLHFVI